MAFDAQSKAPSPAAMEFISQVEKAYTRLIAADCADREMGLGGKLLYAGEMDDEGRVLVAAANIAGAASLTATADRAAQKRAVRDGIADFLVNSLDESLRILKNQLRKREAVAVCVGVATEAVEREMRERGVLPDLLRGDGVDAPVDGRAKESNTLTWSVAAAPAQWLPKLDAIALDCLSEDAWRTRHWLRLAPRYLGRLAQGLRLVRCDSEFAKRFVEQVRLKVESGEIGVAVEIRARDESEDEKAYRFEPVSRG